MLQMADDCLIYTLKQTVNKHVVFQFWHNFVFKNTGLLHKNDHMTEMELQDGKIQDQD